MAKAKSGTKPEAARTGSGKFAPGHSGNPGGRPKGSAELREAALEHCPGAIRFLAQTYQDESVDRRVRVSAACALLDRGIGKPLQAHELTGKDGGAVKHEHEVRDLTDKQIEEQIKALIVKTGIKVEDVRP